MNATTASPMVSSAPIPLPDARTLNRTIGAIMIGGVVASILYGITCMQCFIFFQRSTKKQLPLLNISVWAIWVFDTVHLAILVGHTMYWYMVENWGNTPALGNIPWSLTLGIMLTTFSDAIVQVWFTYRLWILSKHNKWLTFPVLFMQVSLWIIATVSGIQGFWLHTFEEFTHISQLLFTTIALIIASDFITAGSLCYFLYQSRRATFSRKTKSVIDLLIIYSVNTGLLTSTVATITLVLYITLPDTFYFLGIYYQLEKLFVNSLLASLNARDWVNNDSGTPITLPLVPMGDSNDSDGSRRPTGGLKRSDSQASSKNQSSRDVDIHIHMETTKSVI